MLPKAFSDLDELVPDWAFPTESERSIKRSTSTMDEIKAFRERMDPRVPEAVAYLDTFPLGELEESERNLLHLVQSYLECALAIDLYGEPELPVAFPRERFQMNTLPRYEFGEVGRKQKATLSIRR